MFEHSEICITLGCPNQRFSSLKCWEHLGSYRVIILHVQISNSNFILVCSLVGRLYDYKFPDTICFPSITPARMSSSTSSFWPSTQARRTGLRTDGNCYSNLIYVLLGFTYIYASARNWTIVGHQIFSSSQYASIAWPNYDNHVCLTNRVPMLGSHWCIYENGAHQEHW